MPLVHFQDGGQVRLNTTPELIIDKITSVETQMSGQTEYSDATQSGDTQATMTKGLPSDSEVTITLNLYDQTGIASTVKKLRKGHADFNNVTATLRPEGTGAGKPTQAWPDLELTDKSVNYQAGRSRPPTAATVTFKGRIGVEPAWTAQT